MKSTFLTVTTGSLLALVMVSTPLKAQNNKVPLKDLRQLYREIPSDPYMPNAYGNKKMAPGYRFRSSALRKQTGSTIFTSQVNVDPSTGFNYIGDAANEPSLAVNPFNPDQIAIGWRQFDNVASNFRQGGWGYTNDGGQNWTFPGVLEPGVFRSDPVLDYDINGNFYYNSLTNSPTYLCKVFRSTDSGVNWDTGVDAAGGDKQWMALDRSNGVGTGNIYSFWSLAYSSCQPGHFNRSANGGNSYEPCIPVDGEPALGTLTVGKNGELYVAGVSSASDSLLVVKSVNAQTPGSAITWNQSAGVFVDGYLNGFTGVNPVGLYGQINVDVDRSNGAGANNVYVMASITSLSTFDPADVVFSKSTDGGLTWSAPIIVNDDASNVNTQWFATMGVAPNGRIDAVWLDTRLDITSSDLSALYYSYSVDQGATWSANEQLSPTFDPHVGYPNQQKMGDYFDIESTNAGAHLAWANTLNGEQDVYYSFIVPPVASGMEELEINQTLNVFPNPTEGAITIDCANTITQIEIYNVLGTLIHSSIPNRYRTTIDLSSQSSGIYFVKVTDSTKQATVKKIMVK